MFPPSSPAISIHALLTESDSLYIRQLYSPPVFLSTLSLRRATFMLLTSFLSLGEFLSTLSLRRATLRNTAHRPAPSISIHALLTESDSMALGLADAALISIHALLTESDPAALRAAACCLNFYPRSPYGERRIRLNMWRGNNDFYPRSPYGERPCSSTYRPLGSLISIHALLTESDPCARCIWRMCGLISIHALLTESDLLMVI